MNEQTLTLEYIIDAFAAVDPNHATLAEWVKRYPRYASELTEFAATWAVVETMPAAPVSPAQQNELLDLARAITRRKISELRPKQAVAPLAGLLVAARAKGLALGDFATATGLSVPLLTKLDRRLIRAASVPQQVVEAISNALATTADSVSAYLQGPQLHAVSANYLSKTAPTMPDLQDFADAVRSDRTLSAEQKARLLAD